MKNSIIKLIKKSCNVFVPSKLLPQNYVLLKSDNKTVIEMANVVKKGFQTLTSQENPHLNEG